MRVDRLRAGLVVAVMAALVMHTGCDVSEQDPAAVPPPSWEGFAEEFIDRYFDAVPTAGVWAGRHEHDGQLPDVSAKGIATRRAMLRDFAERAQREFSAESLSAGEDLERRHLVAALDGMLFWLEVAESHRHNPAWYARAISPSVYVSRDYASRAARLEALTSYLGRLPTYLEQMRVTLEPPFPRPFVRTAMVRFGGLATHLAEDAPTVFAEVEEDALQQAFSAALEPAVAALRDVEAWLELQLEDSLDDFALGEERYLELLWRVYRIDLDWRTLKAVAPGRPGPQSPVAAGNLQVHRPGTRHRRLRSAGA